MLYHLIRHIILLVYWVGRLLLYLGLALHVWNFFYSKSSLMRQKRIFYPILFSRRAGNKLEIFFFLTQLALVVSTVLFFEVAQVHTQLLKEVLPESMRVFFEFYKKFLSVWTNLLQRSRSDILFNRFPVLAKKSHSVQKLVVLLICPSTLFVVLGAWLWGALMHMINHIKGIIGLLIVVKWWTQSAPKLIATFRSKRKRKTYCGSTIVNFF